MCSALMFGSSSFSLPFVLLGDQLLHFAQVQIDERRQRADVDDVLEQLALARIAVLAVADLRERHAQDVDVVAELRRRQRPRGVVEQVAAGLDLGQVLVPGLRIHRDHQVDAAAPAEVAGLGHAHLVPGGQPWMLDGKMLRGLTGTPMRRMRFREQRVGARPSRSR